MRRYGAPGLVAYLVRHPRAAPDVLRMAWRLRRDGWYRTRPFLPVPDDAYMDFRRTTASGSRADAVAPRDVVDAASWAARQHVGRS